MLDTIIGGMKEKFHWTLQDNYGFETLKKSIVTQAILVLPSFDKPFTMEYDARIVAIGEVLSQQGSSVAFHIEKLNDAKRKYSSYELNLSSLV